MAQWRTSTRDAPWVDAPDPIARRTPRSECEVLVLGAGITGLTTALLLARSGRSVGVVEAETVAGGTTGGSTAKATALQGSRLHALSQHHPDEVVHGYAAAQDDAVGWIAATCDELEVPYRRLPAFSYALTEEGEQAVTSEHELMSGAGLGAELDADPGLPFPVRAAVRLDDQLQLDPRAYCGALAAELERLDGWVWTGARVESVGTLSPHRVRLRTSDGRQHCEAGTVVVATGSPILDRGLYFARLHPERSYLLAVTLNAAPPQGMYISVDQPTRSLRPGTAPQQLLVGGDGHEVAHGPAESTHYDALESWADELFGVRTVTHAWAAQDYRSPDGLPYVGRLHPQTDTLWVATGFAKWGITAGTAAGTSLAGQLTGEADGPPSWEPWRIGPVSGWPDVALLNARVAVELASGWVGAAARESRVAAEGDGEVYRQGTQVVATSTVDDVSRTVSGVCTHLGGILRWNDAEASWDCPLHGSRFAADGSVLCGPASRPLADRSDLRGD